MGNTAGGHKRRGSIDDDFISTSSTGPHYDRKKHHTFPVDEDDRSDASVMTILTGGNGINAIADQLRDSRLCDSYGKPVLYVGGPVGGVDVSESHLPAIVPTVFRWEGGGKEVFISGTFNGWRSKIPMVRSSSKRNFYTIIDLPVGEHQYKFIVDGQWKVNQNQPVVTNGSGVHNNTMEVKLSDMDVLTALSHDIANSRGTHDNDDTPSSSCQQQPMESDSASGCQQSPVLSGHLTPPGEYGRAIPSSPIDAMTMNSTGMTANESGKSKHSGPPMLPPQLLQVILNCDTNVQCDPNLLPQPNHVMVNHMYALSIKDGVIVLSAITRYRQKFVSTVLYKPI